MRSLFAKTLLWFLATTAVALTGITVTTALTVRASESGRSPFSMILNLQLEDAKRAYETGGAPALANVLSRYGNVTDSEVIFTNADGKDLLTGQVRLDLKKRMAQRRRKSTIFPALFGSNRQPIIARADAGKNYWLFLTDARPSNTSLFWFLQPQQLWIVAMVVLLCYGFAYHLTSPVKRLQQTVDRFGRGDLVARAETNRRDELGQLARTFNQMGDRIQTLLTAERRLLQDISHELRSPLARLGVAIELARSGDNTDSAFDRIQREAERLNSLVGELLQVTRAEGDPSKQKLDPVRIDETLAALVYDCEIEATAKDCRLTLKTQQPVTVLGDEELLRRAVENVLRNAIRHAPNGTAIEIELGSAGTTAAIRIRDYGPGVPEESLPRIFDAFYRVDTDRNRTSGGVGLGLAIARRAVELHKGTLRAQNVRPGLLVTLDLPVTAPALIAEQDAVLT